jgi:hypothetical protein
MTPAAAEDTPFGFGGAPAISGSVAAFKRRCEWFYVDPAGQEHGPVPFSKLASWYKKGHFPEDVKVGVFLGEGGAPGLWLHCMLYKQAECDVGWLQGVPLGSSTFT